MIWYIKLSIFNIKNRSKLSKYIISPAQLILKLKKINFN